MHTPLKAIFIVDFTKFISQKNETICYVINKYDTNIVTYRPTVIITIRNNRGITYKYSRVMIYRYKMFMGGIGLE